MSAQQFPKPDLKQRGRAAIDFYALLFFGSQKIRDTAAEDTNAVIPKSGLPSDLDERNELLESALHEGSPDFRVQQLVGEFYSLTHGAAATEAFNAIKPDIQDQLRKLERSGECVLHVDPDFSPPKYWAGVNFHRTEKGWDRHPDQGYIHGEIIHRKMVDAVFPGGIFTQRRSVAALAPQEHYERILEMGCSTGHYTQALSETYPDAEIHGVELALPLLKHTLRVGNSMGKAWQLYQRSAEDTQLEAASFDLVTSYILLHEMPAETIKKVFAEAFRVLKPGGDLLMSDVTRYSEMDDIGQWRADRGAKYGGEPYWRESASLDLAQIASDAGFEDVSMRGLGPNKYPYIVQGRKPG